LYPGSIFAQLTASSSLEVELYGEVLSSAIPPLPPPPPSPIVNNGVPLTQKETGTDTAIFKGYAYPGSTITVLKNGLPLNGLPANIDGTFEVPIYNIQPGIYTFGVKAEYDGLSSFINTYTIYIKATEVTTVDDIYLSPTITTDKIEVLRGSSIVFSGKAIPNSTLALVIYSGNGITKNIRSDGSGNWRYSFDSREVPEGDITAKIRSSTVGNLSSFSNPILFTVGKQNKIRKARTSVVNARCDLNNDGRVNILDFSIMAFWYKRFGFPQKVDLNSDSRVNLTDLSILAYCWTG
jgi:hypothetical protein